MLQLMKLEKERKKKTSREENNGQHKKLMKQEAKFRRDNQ